MTRIGLIREGKIPADNRVSLTPAQCKWILKNAPQIQIVAQSSTNRCFSDREYLSAGVEVKEDISNCDILLGIKEVPADQLIPDKTYLFFSHTKKKQPHNQHLLRAVLDKNIRLVDYECLEHEDGQRIIGFGFFDIASLNNRGIELTYFEVLTVIALAYFKDHGVDYVVLETGLGGRLDATNVVDSLVAVITPISLDHMHILGKTIKAIAGEKAGIIKSSTQQVVIALQEKAAMDVILARCQQFGIKPVVVEGEIDLTQEIALKGAHQRVNAAVAAHAIEALKVFGSPAYPGLIHQAIAVTRWAGRFELLSVNPVIIADGAHNEASARALVRTVKDHYPEHRVILVLAMSSDKDVSSVAAELKLVADTVILTKAAHPRAHEFSRSEAQALFHPKPWFVTEDIGQAMELARSKVDKKHLILVTGSLFIVAQARKLTHVSI